MTKVVKVVASEEGKLAIVTLDDNSEHVLTVVDFDGFAEEITADAKSGELAEYLDGIPDMFRDSEDDLAEARAAGNDWVDVYTA